MPRIFPRPAPAEAPFVSVLVPARTSNIAAFPGSLGAQDYPAFEVIAVDG